MSPTTEFSGAVQPGEDVEIPVALSRADLALLLASERRLASALARPAEVLRFFLLAVSETASLLQVDRALLCLIDSEDPLLLRVMAGTGALAEEEGELLPIEGSFEGRVFHSDRPVRTNDLSAEDDDYRPRIGNRRGGPAVAVPLRVRGRSIGVLLAAREPGGAPFLERDCELLRAFAAPVTAAIESMRQFDAGRRSRESVEAWKRERRLRGWIDRYEALSALRCELVFRLDSSGNFDWGGSTESLFGVAPGEFAAGLDELLQRMVPEGHDEIRREVHAMMNPAGPPSISIGCRMILRDGSVRTARLRAWRTGDAAEIVGVLTPSTDPEGEEKGGQERAFPAVESQVEEAGSEAETIVRALRHQINNPLAAVIGRAQLMIREDLVQKEPALRQAVETILFESERISRFVQQLQGADGLNRLSEPLPGEAATPRW